jgi:uncharacterized membrane protein YphA (DoxX/SURF4 family)
MNVTLWVVQILLGVAFMVAGVAKATQPRAKLQPQMGWVENYSDGQVKGIGVVEILGGLGLILPAWTGILPILTPLAATGLAITMVLAAIVHIRRDELSKIAPSVVLLVLAAFVAWGRFGPYSY